MEEISVPDLDAYNEQMQSEIATAVIAQIQAASPEEAREIFSTALKLNTAIDRLGTDIDTESAVPEVFDVLQEGINQLATKLGLDPASFSVSEIARLVKESDEQK